MTMIVRRSVLAVVQSLGPNPSELSDATCGCPMTHTPVASLRLAVTWPDTPKQHAGRNQCESRVVTAIFPLAVLVLVFLAAAATAVGTSYLSGVLVQRIQQFHQFNEPRAQYSDVWNWQRAHR
jgi:hypothetical protein